MLGKIMMESTTMVLSRQAPEALPKVFCHGGHQHLHAQQAKHHAGDAAQQLNGRDHHRAHLRAGRLGQEHRRQQADGHTDDGSAQRAVDAGKG